MEKGDCSTPLPNNSLIRSSSEWKRSNNEPKRFLLESCRVLLKTTLVSRSKNSQFCYSVGTCRKICRELRQLSWRSLKVTQNVQFGSLIIAQSTIRLTTLALSLTTRLIERRSITSWFAESSLGHVNVPRKPKSIPSRRSRGLPKQHITWNPQF